MIDEKKLIERLETLKRFLFHDECGRQNISVGKIIDLLKNAEKVGEWIPVSERLPESDDDVIVTCKSCRTGKKFTSTDYRNCKTGEWSYFGRDVIAWQPLPEPYREESLE